MTTKGMKTKKSEVKAKGIKITIQSEGKEIARAFLYLMKNDQHKTPFGLLEDVYVDETKRGEGLGTQIVKEAIKEAKKQKCYKLICTSRYEKPKVHKLYLKLGFYDHGKEFRMDF
jgi:GNAT superfamily N-acetyltransferase